MAEDQIPEGFIPDEATTSVPAGTTQQNDSIPAGFIPEDQFIQAKYGTKSEMAKTAIEQGLAGATLGASKIFETQGIPALGIPAITTPEAIAGREKANPATAFLSTIAGTTALIGGTGGLGGLAEGSTLAARIAVGALEGAGISGVSQATDDWSQNKALDAQKIVASAGLGALLGAAGGAIAEVISARLAKARLAKAPEAVTERADVAGKNLNDISSAPISPIEFKGVQPTTYDDIANRVTQAKQAGTFVPLPAQNELGEALSRIPMENPVNPLQMDSLSNQAARDIYQTAKETPGDVGSILGNYEALQKIELLNKTERIIADLAPEAKLTADAYQGGQKAIEAFTDQYQTEKELLAPIFENLKKVEIAGDLLPDAVKKMTQAVPGVSSMLKASGEKLSVLPYKTSWGIDKATYNAVKEVVDALQSEENPTIQTLWNVRKGLDQHVDVLAQGQAPREIRSLKAALMDQMQDVTGNPTIRDAFKRYAINEQQRQVIEKAFGASVGSPEFGQISKVKPEAIGDKIFGNTATVEAARNILGPQQFKEVLGNWLSEAKASATDKGAFSSNKFASFLKRNQDALNLAFQDNPAQFQSLKDLSTIMRILPDAPSVNPSGTAKTLARMLPDLQLHNLTWEGMLASIPKKAAAIISKSMKMKELNAALSGQALRNAQQNSLKVKAIQQSDKIDAGIRSLFGGAAGQVPKVMP